MTVTSAMDLIVEAHDKAAAELSHDAYVMFLLGIEAFARKILDDLHKKTIEAEQSEYQP